MYKNKEMKIVHDEDGVIYSLIETWHTIEGYYYHYPQKFKDRLSYIIMDNIPHDIYIKMDKYRIINKKLVYVGDSSGI